MLNPDVDQQIELTYPNFVEYSKKVKGYLTWPSLAQVKLWHEYLAFQREITEAMYATESTKPNP
jgi:hypothetical protein